MAQLLTAVRDGELEVVLRAIDNRALRDWQRIADEAVRYGRVPVIRELFNRQLIDGTRIDSAGRTVMHCAAFYGQVEVINLLRTFNIPLTQRDSIEGGTVLHWAARGGQVDIFEMLHRESGIDINARDYQAHGRTPFNWASAAGQGAVISWLLAHNGRTGQSLESQAVPAVPSRREPVSGASSRRSGTHGLPSSHTPRGRLPSSSQYERRKMLATRDLTMASRRDELIMRVQARGQENRTTNAGLSEFLMQLLYLLTLPMRNAKL